jgi:hypothetical protein
VQNNIPCIWALVNTEEELEVRTFATLGTGHPVSTFNTYAYIGTYQLEKKELVFHVFEEVFDV